MLTYNPAHVQTKSAAQGLEVKIIVIGDQVDKDCVPFTDLVRSQLAMYIKCVLCTKKQCILYNTIQ